ncbi:head maturation protease, ClpP-related [Microbacterium testaceum]|uniref:head maturation protease, ClpP-related n=1 Tax=Microbacterium testaceum TaxID=2033 RepID=UPI002434A5D1|nr:head maturation protease, ClpP-related [Microbacterium testaceum]
MNDIRPAIADRKARDSDREHQPRRFWGSMEPPESKAQFFSAVTAPTAEGGDATVATIRMYGPIDSWGGWWGISTEDVGRVLDSLPDSVAQIVLRINSPGGEVWEAMAILNMLGAHKATVVAVVDGLAASAASFIAASCDETVMSPGSQMMIHSPSSITWGNAVEMRKTADFLDTVERSMIEVYTEKAGAKDWASLLAAETWLTAEETVELGLADRRGVVPDAGTATTVGVEEDLVIITVTPEEDDADADARIHAAAASARAAAPKPPSSSEPGEPNQKEKLPMSDTIKAGLIERLGVKDADISDEALLEALDESLEEQADPTPAPAAAALPKGFIAIDENVWNETQANARQGADARKQQDKDRRDGIVDAALRAGQISTASAAAIREQLESDEKGTVAFLATVPKNTVPVTEIGKADTLTSSDDALYASAWGAEEKQEA